MNSKSRSETRTWTALASEMNFQDGQFVLVKGTVNLGIAIYSMPQGEGIRNETLFRDEQVVRWLVSTPRSTRVC
jgi:hypothetical protein